MKKAIFVILISIALGACGTVSINTDRFNSQFTVSEKADKSAKYYKSISRVLWVPEITQGHKLPEGSWEKSLASNETLRTNIRTLKEALILELKKSNLMGSSGPFYIRLFESHEKFPGMGIDMIGIVKTKFKILQEADSREVGEEIIETQFRGSLSDSVIGVTRSIIALEGAWRKNIETLIQRLVHR